ncbi:deaminase [uncultured Duncaniella sp.]|uniref:deoxycytidylate deaminase n=1 Tax=uncultured Duncaniella sp. TaxID=2768039 RepID=UPI002638091A|nr:deaminase [uncultured Duncaniella sp.]
MSGRIEKDFYYLNMAQSACERSTCMRRNFGCIIVKDDVIVSTGYNGAPRGRINCTDRGICYRIEHNIPRGTQYDRCRSCHAEWNAMIAASREEMKDSTLYIYGREVDTGEPVENIDCCTICRRMIINAGISRVVFADSKRGVGSDFAPYRARSVLVQEWIDNDDTLQDVGDYTRGETHGT